MQKLTEEMFQQKLDELASRNDLFKRLYDHAERKWDKLVPNIQRLVFKELNIVGTETIYIQKEQ